MLEWEKKLHLMVIKRFLKRDLIGSINDLLKVLGVVILASLVVTNSSTALSSCISITKSANLERMRSTRFNKSNHEVNTYPTKPHIPVERPKNNSKDSNNNVARPNAMKKDNVVPKEPKNTSKDNKDPDSKIKRPIAFQNNQNTSGNNRKHILDTKSNKVTNNREIIQRRLKRIL